MIFVMILLGFWLPLSGHYDVLTTVLGVISVYTVIYLSKNMELLEQGQHTLFFYRHLPAYVGWLLVQIVIANFDVAWRILHPRLPIKPTFVRIARTQRKDLTGVVYANSITLTPGTISTNLDADCIEVHILTAGPASKSALQELDHRVSMLEIRKNA